MSVQIASMFAVPVGQSRVPDAGPLNRELEALLLARQPVAWGEGRAVLSPDNLLKARQFHEAWDEDAPWCAPDDHAHADHHHDHGEPDHGHHHSHEHGPRHLHHAAPSERQKDVA